MRLLASSQAVVVACVLAIASAGQAAETGETFAVARVVNGDTIRLVNGQTVRLAQIDAPGVSPGVECYGLRASAITKALLPKGTAVRLRADPSTYPFDEQGRILRYVIRDHDGVNVNLRLVSVGAAAPYFSDGHCGQYAPRLVELARNAKARKRGLWGACPRTKYDPSRAVDTRHTRLVD